MLSSCANNICKIIVKNGNLCINKFCVKPKASHQSLIMELIIKC